MTKGEVAKAARTSLRKALDGGVERQEVGLAAISQIS
jgi:hypothetical protein